MIRSQHHQGIYEASIIHVSPRVEATTQAEGEGHGPVPTDMAKGWIKLSIGKILCSRLISSLFVSTSTSKELSVFISNSQVPGGIKVACGHVLVDTFPTASL